MTTTVGTPFLLKPEVIAIVCNTIRRGAPLTVAAVCADVNIRTLQKYLERGEAAYDGTFRDKFPDTHNMESYLELYNKVTVAEAKCICDVAIRWHSICTSHSLRRTKKFKWFYKFDKDGNVLPGSGVRLVVEQTDVLIPPNAGLIAEWLSRRGGEDFRVTRYDNVKWTARVEGQGEGEGVVVPIPVDSLSEGLRLALFDEIEKRREQVEPGEEGTKVIELSDEGEVKVIEVKASVLTSGRLK